jgi:hypothetical protein
MRQPFRGVQMAVQWRGVKLNDSYCARKMAFHRILPSQLLLCPPSVTRAPLFADHKRQL